MAKNVFDQIGDIRNNIHRNNFDWSKTNNFTTALGRLTPVYCELCPPNSSLKIKPRFGLRFMPMMFPVQTNMKAYLSFYKVPLRTLWKDFRDWVSSPNDQSSKLEPPYIVTKENNYIEGHSFGVSGLADYLNIPIVSPVASLSISTCTPKLTTLTTIGPLGSINNFPADEQQSITAIPDADMKVANILLSSAVKVSGKGKVSITFKGTEAQIKNIQTLYQEAMVADLSEPDSRAFSGFGVGVIRSTEPNLETLDFSSGGKVVYKVSNIGLGLYDSVINMNGSESSWKFTVDVTIPFEETDTYLYLNFTTIVCKEIQDFMKDPSNFVVAIEPLGQSEPITAKNSPYYLQGASDNDKRIKLSAYPFRAYEACYNAYMRNIKNNPFKINGEIKYNTWIPTDEGGADETDYGLHYANWASDMFTTAVPSPQQGQAPLVGITTYQQSVMLENGHTQTEIKTAIVDEEGNKYAVSYENNDEELKNVSYRLLDQNTPVQQVNNLYDLVTSGISINDFRNVNAYQRYLELNQMRGYSYKEIIDGRFDVNVKYCDLLMPEYLGGCTRDISMNPITQTVETNDTGTYQGALGSQAGNATLFGESEDISVFCDEESIVIGIMSVVPMPVYTQVLPKHFLYRERLDSFNPEFDHIGFQPITYAELCPALAFSQSPDKLKETFGYQRPWYEYCQKLDTASGLFRTQLRNFLINRVFDTVPSLNSAFTTVDPSQVNDVFSVTETTDKILGQIYFDVVAKLPISRVSVPKLE